MSRGSEVRVEVPTSSNSCFAPNTPLFSRVYGGDERVGYYAPWLLCPWS